MIGVLLDLDGTLIDSLGTITRAANSVLTAYGHPVLGQDVVAEFVGLGEEVFVDRLIGETSLERAHRPEIMDLFLEHYSKNAQETVLFSGVSKALDRIAARGVPMGLVTNKPRGPLVPTLAASGLGDMFAVVVAGDDFPMRKPDPVQLLHAQKQLAVERCVYVGDSEIDAGAAQNAGMPFVLHIEGIRKTPVSEIAHAAAFSDFSELPEILLGNLWTVPGN